MKRLLAVSLTWLLVAAGTSGQQAEKPAPLTREQQEQLKERDRLWTEAKKLRQAGKLLEAIAAAEKTVAIQRAVFGPSSSGLPTLLNGLADMQEMREDFAAARKTRQEVLRLQTQLLAADHWRVTDARLALAQLAALMTDVCRGLQQGRPASDALRDAQLQMIRAGKPPRSWAPFILIGAREPGQQP